MRTPRRTTWGWAVVAAMLGWAASAGAQPVPPPSFPGRPQPAPGRTADTVIVPGYSIGPWTLDARIQDLLYRLAQDAVAPGEVSAQIRRDVKAWVWTAPPLIALAPYTSPTLLGLGISGPGYATRGGVGTGATESRITAAYGEPVATVGTAGGPKLLLYDHRGIAFRLPFDRAAGVYGGADTVFVFRPGQAAAIWRVP